MESINVDLPEEWQSIKLGQLLKIVQLGEYGKRTREIWKTDAATFSREVSALERAIGIELTQPAHGDTKLTEAGKLFADLFGPWVGLCNRISNGEIANLKNPIVKIGAGGSLAGWLLGARLPEVKRAIFSGPVDSKVKVGRVNIQAFRNRDIVLQVAAGALDCGLVRKGVLNAVKAPIKKGSTYDVKTPILSRDLGIVRYFFYIPESWLPPIAKSWDTTKPIPEAHEKIFLATLPLATVGPHGEFFRVLQAALYDNGIFPTFEYTYRAFTMLLPHLRMKTHAIIMPDIRSLEGKSKDTSELSSYKKFPLGLLADYTRNIMLVYSKDHVRRCPNLNFDELAKALLFD